ncbi:MAG: hypothetical protein AAF220_12245, partial [Pseudomonadota bacterium]
MSLASSEHFASSRPDTTPHNDRPALSVRAKLLAALCLVATTSVVSGVSGVFSFGQINSALSVIRDDSIPQLSTAQRISELGSRVAFG